MIELVIGPVDAEIYLTICLDDLDLIELRPAEGALQPGVRLTPAGVRLAEALEIDPDDPLATALVVNRLLHARDAGVFEEVFSEALLKARA